MRTITVLLLSISAIFAQSVRSSEPRRERAAADVEHMSILVEPIYAPFRAPLGLPQYGFTVSVFITDSHSDSANLCVTFRDAESVEPITRCAIAMRYIGTTNPGFVTYWFYTSDRKPTLVSARASLMTLAGDTAEVRFEK